MILVVSFSLLYGFFVLVFWQFSHNWTVCRATATTSEFCIACMIASQAILNINFIMLWVMSSSNVPPFVFYSWYQKRISDYISRLQLYSYFRRGGLEIGLIFFHKENERKDGVLEGGQMHREVHYVLVQCWNGRLVHESSWNPLPSLMWWYVS